MPSISASLHAFARSLLREPGFFLITVFTLAVGIGANVAIFTVVNSVLLQPLPYPEPGHIMAVQHTAPGLDLDRLDLSDGTYYLYRRDSRSFEELGAYWSGAVTLTGGQAPERVGASGATASVFSILRVPAALGRTLQPADDQPGAAPVVVLSDKLWHRQFAGDPAAVGSTLRVDGVARQIVGVMPAGFHFPQADVELWLPLPIDPNNINVGNFSFAGIARLKAGVSRESAEKELSTLVWRIADLPGSLITRETIRNGRFAVLVPPFRDTIVGDIGRVLWVLLGSVGLILLIACANVANLFLVRAEGRQREVAVRSALGASRGSLIRLFLGESMALAMIGGVLGLVLAAVGIRVLVAMRPEGLPRLEEIGVDGVVLVFTLAVALLAGVLVGLFAALRYGRPALVQALKEGSRGGTVGRERLRARNALVVVQVALALVLLVGAGLMVKSFWRLQQVDPGIHLRNVLTVRLDLPETEYPSATATSSFLVTLLEKVREIPGVQAAGTVTVLPLTGGGSGSGHRIEDFPLTPGAVPPVLSSRWVSPGYFETLQIPVLQGKVFDRLDPAEVGREAVVSEATARRFWPGQSPLGKRLAPDLGEPPPWYTVVGVVGNVSEAAKQEAPAETVYYPMQRKPGTEASAPSVPRSFTLLVRTASDPLALVGQVRQAVWSVNPNLPLSNIRPMEEVAARSMVRTTFTMLLLVIAAAVALLLGAVGIYGVVSYVVSQRTREIGVRMALGAARKDIARLVLQEGLGLSLTGIAIGVLGALALTRLMVALLFNVSPTDLATFAGVSVLLALIALLACYLPARRAAAVQPLEAIRYE